MASIRYLLEKIASSPFGKYFNTIRYLKARQIIYRILRSFYTPKLRHSVDALDLNAAELVTPFLTASHSSADAQVFQFLGKQADLNVVGWNGEELPKLWRYNQHYFDYLISSQAQKTPKPFDSLIEAWCSENPPCFGVGWEAYPTSLRIVNWIKWHLQVKQLGRRSLESLFLQTRWLSQNLEWHILGNHIFANAKALLFAGMFFKGKEAEQWFNNGWRLLKHELEEQILSDGGHFELSPMYHSIILVDILDLINLSSAIQVSARCMPSGIEKIAQEMLAWLRVLTHPDGDISFFNDSCFDVAHKYGTIVGYAKELGLEFEPDNLRSERSITFLPASGYARMASLSGTMILDVGDVGADYLPGHGHADTLSFEMSIHEHRVIVNGGISTYEVGAQREIERSTAAHNTVEIEGLNSSEVWSSFRVARRARVFGIEYSELPEAINFSASHSGYRCSTGANHERSWRLESATAVITDRVSTPVEVAISYFHIHPDLDCFEKEDRFLVRHKNGKFVCSLRILAGRPRLNTSSYAPKFGHVVCRHTLEVYFGTSSTLTAEIEITW